MVVTRPFRVRRRALSYWTADRDAAARRPTAPPPRRRRLAPLVLLGVVLLTALGAVLFQRFHLRYQAGDVMHVPIAEVSTADYPEDPAQRSIYYGQYNGRRLKLQRRDATHFDFILEPTDDHAATVVFRNVDVSLMTPALPHWCQGDSGLTRIALTDREWNRQQVWFQRRGPEIEVSGGDGFEETRLTSAALAKNCLNAGLWEVILAVEEDGQREMYYQGWFEFPLGHYRDLFEHNTGLSYARHWYYLEHWFDPAGTVMDLSRLRKVVNERNVLTEYDPHEPILVDGEQVRKKRTVAATNLVSWGDITRTGAMEFATFVPPGRYSVAHPWGNEYWRLATFSNGVIREIVTPASPERLHEVELRFRSKDGNLQRILVGGIDLKKLPRLTPERYAQGLYMPMGIGVPPFYQSYTDLVEEPPHKSPYYGFLLDVDGRWIDHHRAAIDGPVMHRDDADPHLLHVYLLSYERHSLIAHFRLHF